MSQVQLRQHNETVLQDLVEGDLVEFDRGAYSHWGVYVGGEDVVHLVIDGNSTSAVSCSEVCGTREMGCVTLESFWTVVNNNKAKKNNHLDNSLSPLAKEEIKKRAIAKIGKYAYNLIWSNCEHFATWCRNDKKVSKQADKGLVFALVIGTVTVIMLSLKEYFKSKKK